MIWKPIFAADETMTYEVVADQAIRELKRLHDQTLLNSKANVMMEKTANTLAKGVQAQTQTVERMIAAGVKETTVLKTNSKGEQAYSHVVKDTTAAIAAKNAKLAESEAIAKRTAAMFATLSNAQGRLAQQEIGKILPDRTSQWAATRGASPSSIANFESARLRMQQFVSESAIAGTRFREIWENAARGIITTEGGLSRVSLAVMRTRNALLRMEESAMKSGMALSTAGKVGQASMDRTATATKTAEKASRGFHLTWGTIVKLMAVQTIHRLVSQITMAIREGTQAAIELGIKIAEIQTISQNAELSARQWGEGLRELSDAFGFGILDQAEGAYQALSNQIAEGADTLLFLEAANKLAVATVSSTEEAVNGLTAVINAYSLGADDANDVSAALFKTVELGRVRMGEVSKSIGDVAVLASQLNINYQELLATIQTITIQGVAYHKAQSQLRGIFIKLLNPTEELKKVYSELGVETGEEAISIYNLGGLLQELQTRTEGSSAAWLKFINRIRGITGALAIVNDDLVRYKANLKETQNAQESFNKAFAGVLASEAKQVQITMNQIKNFFIEGIGRELISTLTTVVSHIKTVANYFGITSKMVQDNFVGAIENAVTVLKWMAIGAIPLLGIAIDKLAIKLRALAVAHPFLAWAMGAQLLLETVFRAVDRFNEAVVAEWEATDKRIQKFVQLRRDYVSKLTQTIISAQELRFQEAAKQASRLIGQFTGSIKSLNAGVDSFFDNFKDNIKDTFDIMGIAMGGVDDAIGKAQSTIESIEKSIEDIRKNSEKEIFDISIKDLELVEQFDAIGKRVEQLKAQLENAFTEDQAKDLYAERTKLIKKQGELAKQIAEKNFSNAERQEKLESDIRKAALAAEKADRTARDKVTRAVKERDRLAASAARSELAQGNEIHREKIANIREELAAIEDLEARSIDVTAGLLEAKFQTINKLKDLALEAQRELLAMEVRKLELAERRLKLELAFREADVTEFRTALGGEDAEAIDRELANRQSQMSNLIEASKEALKTTQEVIDDATAKATEKYLQALAEGDTDRAEMIGRQLEFELDALEKRKQKQIADIKEMKDVIISEEGAAANAISKITLKNGRDELTQKLEDLKTLRDVVTEMDAASVERQKKVQGNLWGHIQKLGDSTYEEFFSMNLEQQQAFIDKYKEFTDSIADPIIKELTYTISAQEVERLKRGLASVSELNEEIINNQAFLESLEVSTRLAISEIDEAGKAVSEVPKNAKEALDRFALEVDGISTRISGLLRDVKAATIGGTGGTGWYASGGSVHGTDSVPALLAPGEFVMNANASKRFYTQLQAMNNGVSRFADGGSVNNSVSTGDFNINMQSSGNSQADVVRLGRLLRREVRRGTVKLS